VGSTGSSREDHGHFGLANTQEPHGAKRILWVMQLLQVVHQGIFTVGGTTHRFDQEGFLLVDGGVTEDI
jgi:hypothetical protein